ncbi:MAG: DUF86 domain-containing protein [Candidatus Aminicenantes bacterium]|nr:DUF86 domain-containing protein [Candidatus Aminicenantes bacterium]
MTKIAQQKILEKIQRLDEYLYCLIQLRGEIPDEKAFLDDFHLHGLAERYLQLSCQAVIDTLNLIIIERDLQKPESGQEIITHLRNSNIISEELSSRLSGVVGFRNILVHEYGRIDHKRIYDYLMNRLEDFEAFKQEVLMMIKSSTAD